ncbi:Armadillo-type fold [Phytophthora cactorum]|nr:Armadillo-type fold [Phytophthora cactorum]
MKPLQLTLLEMITCTLCNLAAVKNNQDTLTKNSALNILSDILASVGAELRRMQNAVKTDADSAEGAAVASSLLISIRKNCVNSIAMLCCNPKLQVRVRNTGFVPKLLDILRRDGFNDQDDDYSDDEDHVFSRGVDPETEKFVVVALANLALDDRCRPTLVQDGAVPLFLGLLRAPDPLVSVGTEDVADNQEDKRAAALLLKLDCVTALSNLLLHPANFQALVDAGVVPAFLDLIRNEDTSASNSSKEIQKACVYAMLGLAKDPGMKTRLAEATQKRLDGKDSNDQVGAIPTMLAFASRNLANAELCGVCISFFHHLSSRAVNHELLFYEGAVGLLVRVLKKPSTAEAPATIYALWLDCLATLAHLASYEARRSSLLDDGVLEAIQHFLIVSAADQRPRDALTDRSIIKAQYAASQIVYKIHELCSGISVPHGAGPVDAPAFFACLLLLATQSASKNSRLSKSTVALQHRTARRTALTIAKVALAVPQGPRLLAEHADIPPALNMVMRTGIHEAQVCAAIALCNLAAERPTPAKGKPLSRVWRDATVDDFIVITLLRVNSPQTKGICAKALFNLLTHEDARDQLMRDGVLYALLKLARLESDSIRDLALRALYNISLDAKKTAQLLEMELVRCFLCPSNNTTTNDDGEDKSVDRVVATAKTVELQMLQEGVLSVLKNLAKVRDPEMKLYVANVLYNLSCAADYRVAEILVHDESNVLGILVAELKSESKDVRKYAAKTLANLSASSVAVQIMTNDAASAVVSVINDTMKGGKTKTGATPTGAGASSSPSFCVETNCACVFTLRNLFSLELNQRKFISCNGLPTLAALLTSPAMAAEAPTLCVATDMICSLAKLNAGSGNPGEISYEERLVKDGVVRALVAIAKGAMDGSTTRAEENTACMNIATSLSSLSIHPRCHDAMLRDGALDALAVFICSTLHDSDSESVATRTPSSVVGPPSIDSDAGKDGRTSKAEDVRSQRLTSQPSLVPIVLALSQSTSPQTREHVVVSLYNLARLRRSKRQLIKNDAVKVLLRLGTSAITPFKRHVCSLALQALATHAPPPVPAQQPNSSDPAVATANAVSNATEWDDPHVDKVVQEGIVVAIAALADSHQHDLLVSVSTNLYVIATPPAAVTESISLLRTTNRAIEQRGAPPEWTKVLITDLVSWPEIEMGTSRTTAIRVDSNMALGSLSPDLQEEDHGEDSYSDASDDESRREGSQGKSSGKLLSPSSPKKQSQLGHSSNLAPPRTCSSDAVLGWFQLLADPKPEKVRVNVDFELAGRRAVTSSPVMTASVSSSDELPKLRPETAPEGSTEDNSRLGRRLNAGGQSTLTQARQDAASSGTSTYRRLTSNGIYRGNTPDSPLKSPAAVAKRRSHQLEPLSTSN